MARIFAFVTFLCLGAIIVMGIVTPNDPLFIFAASGPLAQSIRIMLAALMLVIASGAEIKKARILSVIGTAGFALIAFGVITLTITQGSGLYPYLQPADI